MVSDSLDQDMHLDIDSPVRFEITRELVHRGGGDLSPETRNHILPIL
jgi:hypothetical protein